MSEFTLYAAAASLVHHPVTLSHSIVQPSCFEGDSLERIVELCDGIMVRLCSARRSLLDYDDNWAFFVRLLVETWEWNVLPRMCPFSRRP